MGGFLFGGYPMSLLREPRVLPASGAFVSKRRSGRSSTRQDHVAFMRRVAKRRAKKGYA